MSFPSGWPSFPPQKNTKICNPHSSTIHFLKFFPHETWNLDPKRECGLELGNHHPKRFTDFFLKKRFQTGELHGWSPVLLGLLGTRSSINSTQTWATRILAKASCWDCLCHQRHRDFWRSRRVKFTFESMYLDCFCQRTQCKLWSRGIVGWNYDFRATWRWRNLQKSQGQPRKQRLWRVEVFFFSNRKAQPTQQSRLQPAFRFYVVEMPGRTQAAEDRWSVFRFKFLGPP